MDSATDRRLEAQRQEGPAGDRAGAPVPAGYAERAMNSLMSLHASLVAEKDRTLDLTRRLMDERQGRAELESYVRLLEAEVARLGGPDLRDAHDGRGDALDRASARILDALRQGPPVALVAAAPKAPIPPASPPSGATTGPDSGSPASAPSPPAVPAPPLRAATPAPISKGPRAQAAPEATVKRPVPVPPPRPATRGTEPTPGGRALVAKRPAPHRVPRPPRPSRRYRTKITSPAPGATGERRAGGSPTELGSPDDDGWRQW